MISAEKAREIQVRWEGSSLKLIPDLAANVSGQAEQIAAAREAINDLAAWGQLEPAAADTLLAILAEDRP